MYIALYTHARAPMTSFAHQANMRSALNDFESDLSSGPGDTFNASVVIVKRDLQEGEDNLSNDLVNSMLRVSDNRCSA